MSYIKQIVTLLAIAVCAFSASPVFAQHSSAVIVGLASPIYLPVEGGEILLEDYIHSPEKIDGLIDSENFSALLSADRSSVMIGPKPSFRHLENLGLRVEGERYDIPMFRSEKEEVVFEFKSGEEQIKSVQLKSSFNGWTPERSVFVKEGESWVYRTTLNPGYYQYLLVVDGQEMLDPGNEEKQSNGMGGFNSLLEVGKKLEKPFLSSVTHSAKNITIRSSQDLENLQVYLNNQLIKAENILEKDNSYSISLDNVNDGRSAIRVFGSNTNGRSNDLYIPLENGQAISESSDLKRQDFHTQIMYFLMVDRFLDGNEMNTEPVDDPEIHPKANYYGGDLEGVVQKLEAGYFEDLGTNTIWLSPITQNPKGAYGLYPEPLTKFSGYHGYWPISSTQIDYRFGTVDVLKSLIEGAHEKEMNVILDYVANHVHEEHPLYKAHPDWATSLYLPDGTMNTENWDSHRLTTWFDTFMPTLDFSKPEVISAMTDSAAYWVQQYDLDGFRHDATKHIQEEFWRELTKKVKQLDRPIYQVGETYGSYDLIRSYINTGMLDGQFDFNLYDASVSAFAKDESVFRHWPGPCSKVSTITATII